MATKFKINTATHVAANHKVNTVAGILSKANMLYTDWVTCLFENGCAFVEKNIESKHVQEMLLQQDFFGFWDWWMLVWINDDESLLSFNSITNIDSYQKEKQRLLNLFEASQQFDHFLKANTKLHELEKV